MIEHAPRDWHEGETQARQFLAAKMMLDEMADPVEETGLKLVRARERNLLGDRYSHLVFADGRRESSASIQLRANGGSHEELPVHVASLQGMRVTEMRVKDRTMLLVGDISREEAVRLATLAVARFG